MPVSAATVYYGRLGHNATGDQAPDLALRAVNGARAVTGVDHVRGRAPGALRGVGVSSAA